MVRRTKRPWSKQLETRLERYFDLRDNASVQALIEQWGMGRDGHIPGAAPEWLLHLCQVGRALNRLEPAERESVERRFEAHRRFTELDNKQATARRFLRQRFPMIGVRDRIILRRDHHQRHEQYQTAARDLYNMERRVTYQRAMSKLWRMLREGEL